MTRPLERTLLVVLAVALAGCSSVTGDDLREYRIRVDRIEAPESVAAGDTLTVGFHGRVGPDGCHRLSDIHRERSSGRLLVTFIGVENTADDIGCTLAIVPLEETLEVPPPFEGDEFTIAVRQPDGTRLTRTVAVE